MKIQDAGKVAYALAIGCPLLQALEMIDQMAGAKYLKRLENWNAPQEIVIRNLRATMLDRMERFGHWAICEDYEDFFKLIEED